MYLDMFLFECCIFVLPAPRRFPSPELREVPVHHIAREHSQGEGRAHHIEREHSQGEGRAHHQPREHSHGEGRARRAARAAQQFFNKF